MLTSRKLAQSSVFIALLAISAHLKIPIGVVPITFQLLVVLLVGLLLDRVSVLYVMIGYIGLGLIGLPIFASGAGLQYLLSPSFGFLIGFIFYSLFVSISHQKIVGILIGYLVLYLIGLTYLMMVFRFVFQTPLSLKSAILSFWVPFLLNDGLSILLALLLYPRLQRIIRKKNN